MLEILFLNFFKNLESIKKLQLKKLLNDLKRRGKKKEKMQTSFSDTQFGIFGEQNMIVLSDGAQLLTSFKKMAQLFL